MSLNYDVVSESSVVLTSLSLLNSKSLDENKSLEKGLFFIKNFLTSVDVLCRNPTIIAHLDKQLMLVLLN